MKKTKKKEHSFVGEYTVAFTIIWIMCKVVMRVTWAAARYWSITGVEKILHGLVWVLELPDREK